MRCWFGLFFIFGLIILPAAAEYTSLGLIDATDWAAYYDNMAGYLYEEPGCVTLSPHDNYLLYKTVPEGTSLEVKRSKEEEKSVGHNLDLLPTLASLFKTEEDISRYAASFQTTPPELAAYPMLGKGVILQNGAPLAQFPIEAGISQEYVLPRQIGEAIEWESKLILPVAAGQYKLSGRTEHYPSAAAPVASLVPFGAWLVARPEGWKYEYYGRWFNAPESIVADLLAAPAKRHFHYFDENRDESGRLVAARFASQPFGRESLVFDGAGGRLLFCAAGEALFERALFIKDLVQLLTAPGPDDLDSCVNQDPNLSFYRQLARFRRTRGKDLPAGLPTPAVVYYKLYFNLGLSAADQAAIDPRVLKAFNETRADRLPRDPVNRRKAIGLYQLVRRIALVIEKQAGWHNQVRRDWKELAGLRVILRQDLAAMGVLSLLNRQNLVEGWLETRLSLGRTAPPDEAKYVGELNFSSFFKPTEKLNKFSAREQAIMLEKVRASVKGETAGLNLNIVPALNEYNFGVLLNEILGNLYRSHGCLHASPRNIFFLYELLPLKTKMNIRPYAERVSAEAFAGLPFLTDLVNYREDLEALKVKLVDPKQVDITVYPATGLWIINLNGAPLAKLSVLGGPKEKMYLVEKRDKRGRPIFQSSLMYPTTPGTYYFFRKTKNYLSNLYRSTTTIPQGGALENREGEWSYRTAEGEWRAVPTELQLDLELPGDKQDYTYYDQVTDASGSVVAAKWGSQPFGTYAIQTTRDGKTAWPELIHSSGDLMMEERSLINDLILVLTAPYDSLADCVTASPSFSLYQDCAAFIADPGRTDLIGTGEAAAYKLYYGLPFSSVEAATLPPNSIAAIKLARRGQLSADDEQALISAGAAARVKGKLSVNRQKVLGLQFEIFQFVVTIEKYSHHYETLSRRWGELSGLRRALLLDFNEFVLKDPELFRGFMRELMLRRNNLEKLTQPEAVNILAALLAERGIK